MTTRTWESKKVERLEGEVEEQKRTLGKIQTRCPS